MSDDLWRRLRRLLGHADEGTDEEIRFHLEMRIDEYVRGGMSEAEARRKAERRMGDIDQVRRECDEIADAGDRRHRRLDWWRELRQDIRYGTRTLVRSPAFALTAVLALTTGIGATTAIFSAVQAVLLSPLPYPEPDQLVRVWEVSPQGETRNVVSSGNVVDWTERATSFSEIGAHRWASRVNLYGESGTTQVLSSEIHPQAYLALRITPLLGRGFTADDATGQGDVALVGHDFWQTRLGADPDVIGSSIVLNDVPTEIVGVVPSDVGFPEEGVAIWIPLTDDELDPEERTSHNFNVLARLAPGVTIEQAQAEMSAIASSIAEIHPAQMTGWDVNVQRLHSELTTESRPLLIVLLGGVSVVLLVTCANLANLLLARAISREREIALRGALGAGRFRLFRQLLTESLLLAGIGGILGLAAASPFLGGLLAVAPDDIPLLSRAALDRDVLLFAALVTVGCGVLFGLVPAVRLSGFRLENALRGPRNLPGRREGRLRSALLVTQVALSVVLLVGAGLFVRSFAALRSVDVGFDPDGLVTMSVDPSLRYEGIPEQESFHRELMDRVAALPGVTGVTTTTEEPGIANSMTFSFGIEGRVATNPSGREDDEPLRAVSAGYFEVMRQQIVQGRGFTEADRADAPPVVIINQSLADKHWPEGDALGQRISFRPGETPWREIVGIVADERLERPDTPSRPAMYIPREQRIWEWLTWSSVIARVRPEFLEDGGLSAVHLGMRTALAEMNPDLPPYGLRSIEGSFRQQTAGRRFAMVLVTGFGVLALLLSVLGLYGVVTYNVARERREIGVRMAIGADAKGILAQVLVRALQLAALGAVVGTFGAILASRALEGLLFGVSTVDAPTYVVIVALMASVAAITAAIPAWRAATTDPARALHAE